jgi:hypothetical protein
MVSLLALGLVLNYNLSAPRLLPGASAANARIIGLIVVVVSGVAIGWAVWQSKREGGDVTEQVEAETK